MTSRCYSDCEHRVGAHWRRIRTNNPLERILREIRRRIRVVSAFPDGQSALNLAAARLCHIAGTERLEVTPGILAAHSSTVTALRRALESAGLEFTDGGGLGGRLKVDPKK